MLNGVGLGSFQWGEAAVEVGGQVMLDEVFVREGRVWDFGARGEGYEG